MDFTQFFNPSSWGFAPQAAAADPTMQAGMAGGKGAMPVPAAPVGPSGASSQLFQMGQKLMNPQQQVPQMSPIHFAQPVGAGRMGMLG